VSAHPHAAARGFTLLELVIAIGMTALLIGASVTLLVNQQQAYQAGAADRGLQEAGQTALVVLGDRLRAAGYGVDPAYVLDFGDLASLPQQGLRSPQKLAAFQTYRCADPVRCRDRSAGPGSDEIVFYSRNPMFSRPVVSASGAAVRMRGDPTRPIRPGQILMVMCLSGNRSRAYVTAAAPTIAAVTPPNPANLVDVALAPGVLTAGRSTFPFQNDQLLDPCFSDGNAVVSQVDRHHYSVSWFTDAGVQVAAQTVGARPYLMLDQGLLDGGGNPILTPVAQDVEDLQLTYFFPKNAAAGPVRPSGAAAGTSIADDVPAITVAVPPPAIDDPPEAASRTTGSPANIVAVRVSVVVRSPDPDGRLIADDDRRLPAAGNRAAFLGVSGYRRALFEDTFLLPNLQSTTVVHCAVGVGPGMNRGGC
jgi:type II secretory pathway pseudopilin PulG